VCMVVVVVFISSSEVSSFQVGGTVFSLWFSMACLGSGVFSEGYSNSPIGYCVCLGVAGSHS
jgi:hypothetical protein